MSFIFWFINKDRSSHLIRNYESCSLTKSTNVYSGINLTNCSFKKDISTYSRTSHMNCCQKKDISIKIVLFCFFFLFCLFTPASIWLLIFGYFFSVIKKKQIEIPYNNSLFHSNQIFLIYIYIYLYIYIYIYILKF